MPTVFERYALPNSYFVDLASPERRRDYRLFIGGYEPERQHLNPHDVVFVVDGNWLFPMVTEHIRLLSLFRPVGMDPIVIGVGYPTDDDAAIMERRNQDMALTARPGNVEAFSQFVVGLALSWVERELQLTVRNCYLAGHSWGGSFALFNMLREASPFSGYVASSPLITGTKLEGLLVGLEDFQNPVRLFYSLGTAEHTAFPTIESSVAFLTKNLNSNPPKNLEITNEIFPGEDHTSVATHAIAKGIQFLLSK
ncbi:MAG: alpha/beta hydrolase-fold protein [Pseudomonadota bacterium]